jgi:hypothetical protein
MKCKKKINIKDGVKTKTKKGVPMIRGKCSICNTKVCVIGNK